MEENKEKDFAISNNKSGKGMGWYVVHTYSGYEQKVSTSIIKAVANRNLQDKILEVYVPVEEVVDNTKKKAKTSTRKIFPGYVLVHMDADDEDAWFLVRNTRGVTGFVGPGSKPVPLSEEEINAIFNTGDQAAKKISIDVEEGDTVVITDGVWKETEGVVVRVDEGKQLVTIKATLFGRETPVSVGFTDVKKVN